MHQSVAPGRLGRSPHAPRRIGSSARSRVSRTARPLHAATPRPTGTSDASHGIALIVLASTAVSRIVPSTEVAGTTYRSVDAIVTVALIATARGCTTTDGEVAAAICSATPASIAAATR